MEEFRWLNVLRIGLGSFVGFIAGCALASYCIKAHQPFWAGKSAEWVSAIGTWLGAIATAIAIYYAVSGGERAIHNAKNLHDQDEQAKLNDRAIRAEVAASAIAKELRDALAQTYESILMLSHPRQDILLTNAYGIVRQIRMPVLEKFAYQGELFGTQTGLLLMTTWTEIDRIKHFADVNHQHASNWSDVTKKDRQKTLRTHCRNLSHRIADALPSIERIANIEIGTTEKSARKHAIRVMANRRKIISALSL